MSEEPDWWVRAKALEQEDRLEEAESVVKGAMLPQGWPWPAQLAELYRLRMERMLDAGDSERARAAAKEAVDYMWLYASGATSGGEGAALSYERDQFRKEIRSALSAHGINLQDL
jgi:hypothetical protein